MKMTERGQITIPKAIPTNVASLQMSRSRSALGTVSWFRAKARYEGFQYSHQEVARALREQLLAEGYTSTAALMKDIRGR